MSKLEELIVCITAYLILCVSIYICLTCSGNNDAHSPEKEIDCFRWLCIFGRRID